MRSVLMSKFVPWPPNSGEKRRTLAIARALKTVGDVTICGFVGTSDEIDGLLEEGFDVRSVSLERSWGKTLPGFIKGKSLSAARFWDPAFARIVEEATSSPLDVLVIEHVQLQMYADPSIDAFRVVDMHNIESALAARVSATKRGPLKAVYAVDGLALRRLERAALESDLVMVVSDADRAQLATTDGRAEVRVVGNGWDPSEVLPPTNDPVVSFVALLSWGPNVDAAVWFATEVWPLVVAQVPDALLQLVGREPAPEVAALASESVKVTGTVPDLTPWYEASLVALAPLRAGGGSRLKILEGLAAGRPIVATTIGAEGLEDLVGDGVLVADSPREMADTVVRLLRSPERAHALGRQGAEAVASRHSWTSAVEPLLDAISAAAPDRFLP